MCLLPFGVSLRQLRTRFPQAEAELAKEPLALPHPQGDRELLPEPRGQRLAVPDVAAEPHLPRRLPEGSVDAHQLRLGQSSRAARPRALRESAQAVLFKPAHPVLDRARGVPQQLADLRTRHALRHQQDPVQPMVVPRLFRPANLILESHNDRRRIRDGEWFHVSMKPQPPIMRNYLCRSV